MHFLETYIQLITDRGNPELAKSISSTAKNAGDKYCRNFAFLQHETALLFGNIQSGKTAQMFGIICAAADATFPVFILLTSCLNILYLQTLIRTREDLPDFCVCGENDATLFIDNCLTKPAIIVLKKNCDVLRHWSSTLASSGFMKDNPLFIVDDEADAASPNTLVNQHNRSSINNYLNSIIENTPHSIYLQVTGTPQALLLQTLTSGWRPYFTCYFEPGDSYLGGDFFFPKGDKPNCICYLEELQHPLRNVVIRHLAVSGQILSAGGTVSNCLVHPSLRQYVHAEYADKVHEELQWCRDNLHGSFCAELKRQYDSITPTKTPGAPFASVFSIAQRLLEPGKTKVLVLNAKATFGSDEYSFGSNIIIGGNTLGRGVTFPSLHTIYYTRTSKHPQADTMWQHSRMFGYDRDPGLMRVYIDKPLYNLFSDINATNTSIVAQAKNGINNIKLYYPRRLRPTRGSVLDMHALSYLTGGVNYYPSDVLNTTIADLDAILAPFSHMVPSYLVDLSLVKEVLYHISSNNHFCVSSFISVIDTILAETPLTKGVLIVRRNRDIEKGIGALLSPDDRLLGDSNTTQVVLTMYKVTGRKGWGGKELWIPNIKLPKDNIVYYDTSDRPDPTLATTTLVPSWLLSKM